MTLDDVLQALKRAHDAGDEQAAKKLASIASLISDPLKAAESQIPVDYTLGEAVSKGFQRGLKQLGSGIFDTLPALGASALGFDEYAKKQMGEAAETEREIAEKYPAQFKSYTEVGSPYQALQYAAETLGELGPSALGVMLPGGVAGVGGRMLAARGAAGLAEQAAKKGLVGEAAKQFVEREIAGAGQRAMYGGVYFGSLAQNVPEVFQNIYEETGKFEPMVAALGGGAMALLDSLVPGQVMSKLGPYGRIKAAEALVKESGAAPSVWKAIGKEAALAAGKEGLTESAQEAISVAAEEIAGSLKGLLSPESIQRYKESFVKGAIGGAGFGVVGGAGRGLAERKAFADKQERDRLAQEEAERKEKLAGEVAASEAQMQGVIDVAKQQPQMELPGMGIGEEYGPASALVPPTVEPTETAPTYTALANSIAQDLGIKIEKSADPEDMVARIREAVNNYIQAPRTPAVSTASILQTLPAEYQRAISFLNAIDNGSITTSKASPKQLSLLGPQGGVTKAAQKNVLRKITPTELENIRVELGINPTAKLFKPGEDAAKSLLGLDLLNPEDAKQAKDVLEAYAEGRSPKIQQSVKKWITTNLDPVITRGAPPDATGTDQQPSGAGTQVPSGGVAAPPAISTEQPKPGGVVPSGSDAGKPIAGEGPQQSTLIPKPGEAPAPEGKKFAPPKTTPAQENLLQFVETLEEDPDLQKLNPEIVQEVLQELTGPLGFTVDASKPIEDRIQDIRNEINRQLKEPVTRKPEAEAVNKNIKDTLGEVSQDFLVGDLVRFGNTPGVVIGVEGNQVRFRPDSATSKRAYQRVPKASLSFVGRPDTTKERSYSREQDKKFGEEAGELGADKEGLIQLLGANLYSANLADVTVKELLQNAFDAVKGAVSTRNAKGEPIKSLYKTGSIDITIDSYNRTISVTDNARGMTPEIVRNAFFTIAGSEKSDLPPNERSGGFGFAKMGFLLGSEHLHLDTVRDGVRVTVDTSARDIAKNNFVIKKTPAPKSEHGTTVTVKIPEKYLDPRTSEARLIWFPWDLESVTPLKKPLLGPVEVTFNMDGNKRTLDLGVHFPEHKYQKRKVNFDWGSADVYFGIESKAGRKPYEINHQILSSGVYQFDADFKVGNEKIPYDIIVNIKPEVDARHPDYPFTNSREGFKERLKKDINALNMYLGQIARGHEAADLQESFKGIESLPRIEADGAVIEPTKAPKKTFGEKVERPTEKYQPPKEIRISGEELIDVLTKRVVGNVGKDAEKKKESTFTGEAVPKSSDFLLTMEQDPRLPIFHNNTNVDFMKVGKEYGDPQKFFAELGTVLVQMKEDLAKSGLWGYETLAPDNLFFGGISVDKEYGGLHLKVPYKAVFINPFYDWGAKTLFGVRANLMNTMIHEIAHTGSMDHGVAHNAQMVKVEQYLADQGLLDYYRDSVLDILSRHESTFAAMKEEYGKSTTRNTAKSLESYQKGTGTVPARGSASRSEYPTGAVPAGERPGRGAGVPTTPTAGAKSQVGAGVGGAASLNEQSVRFPNLANKLVGPNGLADKILRKVPSAVMTPARRTDIWRMLEKLALPARSLVYKALNASQMGEVASKYFGNDSIRFATILNEIGGYRQRIEEKLEPLNRQFVVHREKYPERHAALHALMNDATIADVAPYDDAETAKKYKNTAKEATYEALKKRFNNLNAEEKQLYKSAFTSFVALRNEFKKALKGNISELVKDEATALSIYDKIMNELSQVMIDHYFPLYRKGDFRLSYTLNGKAAVERFESQAERAAAQRALEAQGATDIEATSQLNQFNSDNIPDGTMLSAVMKIVKDAGGGKEDLDKVVQLVVSAFPETSILKRQQKRSGIPGYINDNAALVFDSVTSNNARQIATIKYREELKSLMNKMREKQVSLRGDASEDAKTMFEDLDGRFRFAMDPDIAGWAQYASSTAFYWNLAGNVSSALVQIATVPTVVFPNLGGRYGSTKAWKALNNARKLYQSSGFTRKVEGLDGRVTEEKSMLSIENLVNKEQAKEYAALINALKDTELLTSSTAQNAIRAENRTDSGYGAVNKLQRMTSLYGSFLMHHTERMSREITAVATYDLEMERLKKSKPGMTDAQRQAAAIQEAVRIVQRTHGAVTSTTGTRIGQTSVGKIFMVFKNYAFAQYYNLFSTIFRAFPVKNADPDTLEDIKAARRQLVGMYGMVALFAGVKGVPLYWIAELAYDALRDDEDEDFDALMRRYLGEFLFKGPVNYITNLSIADRVGWTDLIWRENKNDRAGSSAIMQYLESSLAPLSVIKNFEKGASIISETGSWYRGIETMLPASLKNPMKGLRYGSEGANTLRGDPVMADINVGNAAMQALGFAPADLMNQYEENATILARQKAIRGNEQRLLKQYYVALKNGDVERATETIEKLYELGAKYPELKIGPDLLNKSVRERDRFSSKLYHGMRVDDKLRDRLLGAHQIEYD